MNNNTQKRTRNNRKNHTRKGESLSRTNFGGLVQVPALRVTLPHSHQGGLVEGAAALGYVYTFAINNVHDPDFSGGGMQPIGFDQYAALYGRYHVHNFRYQVDFATITNVPIFVGCMLSPQSTVPASAVAWFVTNNTVKYATLGGSSGGDNVARISGKASLHDVFGVTKREYLADQDFGATTSSGPARQAYLHVWVVGRTAVASAAFSALLYYDTELSQPVALSMS